MDEDEAIYQLERKRWQEEEQEEAMLTRRGNVRMVYDSPAIRAPPYCTEFECGDFWRRARRQHVVVLRNGPLRGRCYYLPGIYLLFI